MREGERWDVRARRGRGLGTRGESLIEERAGKGLCEGVMEGVEVMVARGVRLAKGMKGRGREGDND